MTNTERVQKIFADFGRGAIEAILNELDEQIEWVTPEAPEFAASGKLRGRQEVARFFQVVGEMWEFLSFEPRDYVASGEKVVALGEHTTRSRETGRTVTVPWAMAWTFRNGRVSHFEEYTDTAALRDAVRRTVPAGS